MSADLSHLSGAERITEERHRQAALGWSRAHDDEHGDGSLARAAWCYLEAVVYPGSPLIDINWPWDGAAKVGDPIRNLEKAGALIAAEIDRLAAIDIEEWASGMTRKIVSSWPTPAELERSEKGTS